MPHQHSHGPIRLPLRTQRLLLLALAPFVVATIVGLVALWPDDEQLDLGTGPRTQELEATVTDVSQQDCPDISGQEEFTCSSVTARVEEGTESGSTFTFNYSTGPHTRAIESGDDIIVARSPEQQRVPGQPPAPEFFFVDFDRRIPLLLLAVVFSLVVIALSRLRGLAALAGLALSILVLVKFVLPAILVGSDPLLVAIVGGSAIMFLALYLAHGFNAATTTAALGTLVALLLTGVLSLLFTNISIFTGAGSEEAAFLQITQSQVNLQGLLLASIIIGTLGVLDDVTVTQASAVWELHKANPDYGMRNLYRGAVRIGRDHIASTVNTLVLAYAGASLPLLILFSVANRELITVLNTEMVAEEIVRTLVGSIGLVASVPITTGLAALVVTTATREPEQTRRPRRQTKADVDYKAPRRERDFRDES